MQAALYEVGSAVTLFKVKNHEAEFLAFLNGSPVLDPLLPGPDSDDSDEAATTTAEEAPFPNTKDSKAVHMRYHYFSAETAAEVAELFGVGRSTVYRAIERQRNDPRARIAQAATKK